MTILYQSIRQFEILNFSNISHLIVMKFDKFDIHDQQYFGDHAFQEINLFIF